MARGAGGGGGAVRGGRGGGGRGRSGGRVGVRRGGDVVSATVEDRLARGDAFQAAAGRRALEWLRGIRFEPAKRTRFDRPDRPGVLEWGEALFHWRTIAPAKPPAAPTPPPA